MMCGRREEVEGGGWRRRVEGGLVAGSEQGGAEERGDWPALGFVLLGC